MGFLDVVPHKNCSDKIWKQDTILMSDMCENLQTITGIFFVSHLYNEWQKILFIYKIICRIEAFVLVIMWNIIIPNHRPRIANHHFHSSYTHVSTRGISSSLNHIVEKNLFIWGRPHLTFISNYVSILFALSTMGYNCPNWLDLWYPIQW